MDTQSVLQGKDIGELLDLYRDETACDTYNGWWRHFDPKVLRAEIDRRVAALSQAEIAQPPSEHFESITEDDLSAAEKRLSGAEYVHDHDEPVS